MTSFTHVQLVYGALFVFTLGVIVGLFLGADRG
jgi:hypothetical protein